MASPDINTEDYQAAVDFLSVQDNVDLEKIGIIGICGSVCDYAKAVSVSVYCTVDPWEKYYLNIGHVFSEEVFPKFSILNPVFTYTLPKYQMVAGFYDIMNHITEQYFSGEDDNTSDYLMKGQLRSLIHSSRIALGNPEDYEARSNIMWIGDGGYLP